MNDDFSKDNFLRYFRDDIKKAGLCGTKFDMEDEKLFFLTTTDSTNTRLLELAEKNGADRVNLTMYAAEEQTNGRGRIGRNFYSPRRTGIYFSFVFAPEEGITDPAFYTTSACAGICRAIEELYGAECGIKWVNDIYLEGKKVCGILTEGIFNPEKAKIEGVVVGCGINISRNEELPEELESKAGSIVQSENTVPRARLLSKCLVNIFSILHFKEDVVPYYRSKNILRGKSVTVTPLAGDEESSYQAKVLDITEGFGLKVETGSGEERVLSSGEVSLHGTSL